MARARHAARREAGTLDLSRVGALLREAGILAEWGDPVCATARLAAGRVRRVHARYDGGWSAVLRLYPDDSYQLTRSFRIRVSGRLAA